MLGTELPLWVQWKRQHWWHLTNTALRSSSTCALDEESEYQEHLSTQANLGLWEWHQPKTAAWLPSSELTENKHMERCSPVLSVCSYPSKWIWDLQELQCCQFCNASQSSDWWCSYGQWNNNKKKVLKLSINFVHLFSEFSALKIQLECLRMVALNFMHLGSEPIFKRITGYVDLCNGEYSKLAKNTVSFSNPGNYVFSNQIKT